MIILGEKFEWFNLSLNLICRTTFVEQLKEFFGTFILQNFKSNLSIQEFKYPASCSEQSHSPE